MNSSREDAYRAEIKREKWSTVVIVVGILSYILLLLKSAIWTVLFGVFSFRSDLPQCVAVLGTEEPINLLEQ